MKIQLKDAILLNRLVIMQGWTKSDFAKQISMSQPMTFQILNGSRNPSPPVAKRIAETLQQPWEKLFILEPVLQSEQELKS